MEKSGRVMYHRPSDSFLVVCKRGVQHGVFVFNQTKNGTWMPSKWMTVEGLGGCLGIDLDSSSRLFYLDRKSFSIRILGKVTKEGVFVRPEKELNSEVVDKEISSLKSEEGGGRLLSHIYQSSFTTKSEGVVRVRPTIRSTSLQTLPPLLQELTQMASHICLPPSKILLGVLSQSLQLKKKKLEFVDIEMEENDDERDPSKTFSTSMNMDEKNGMMGGGLLEKQGHQLDDYSFLSGFFSQVVIAS